MKFFGVLGISIWSVMLWTLISAQKPESSNRTTGTNISEQQQDSLNRRKAIQGRDTMRWNEGVRDTILRAPDIYENYPGKPGPPQQNPSGVPGVTGPSGN